MKEHLELWQEQSLTQLCHKLLTIFEQEHSLGKPKGVDSLVVIVTNDNFSYIA